MFGNYKQLLFLGSGRYCNVYEVLDERSNKRYAMKLYFNENTDRYFKSEIQALSSISHKNVVKFVEILYSPERMIVLELCTKGDLFNFVLKRTIIDETETKKYVYQLLDGVDALHKAGVCHRDIKLENILLDDNDNLKIADFGFSKTFNRDNDCPFFQTTCGTVQYCAPELFRCKRGNIYNGKKADAWSVGVVCFVLAFGYPPFNAANFMDVRFMYLKSYGNQHFWTNNMLNVSHQISNELQEIISKLLVVNPYNRSNIDDIVIKEDSELTEKFDEIAEVKNIGMPEKKKAKCFGCCVLI